MPKPSSRARSSRPVGRAKIPRTTGKYGGLDVHERRALRRERLLTAGLELFGKRGFASITIGELCTAANVASRTFYEEFGSRDALLGALYDTIVTRVITAVYDAVERAGTDPRAVVRAGVEAYVRAITRDPHATRIMLLEVVGVSAAFETTRRAAMHAFAARSHEVAARFEAAGRIVPADFEIMSLALTGAANELAIEWVLAPEKYAPARLADTLIRLWLGGLRLLDEAAPGS